MFEGTIGSSTYGGDRGVVMMGGDVGRSGGGGGPGGRRRPTILLVRLRVETTAECSIVEYEHV